MDSRFAELVRNAMTPYRLNVTPEQRLLIVTDSSVESLLVQSFVAGARALDLDVAVVTTLPVEFHHAEPNPIATAAAREADVVHLLTSKGQLHADGWETCMGLGKRLIASEELTVEALSSGAATADYDAINRLGERIYEILNAGRQLTITTQEGTNLSADISGRPPWLAAGRARDNPGILFNGCAFPDGECGIAPIEESIQGEIVWDTTMHHLGRLREPVRATVVNGRVVDVSGAQAEELKEYVDAYGDERSWIVAETSIGLNPGARITGNVRTDKKLLGSAHIAIGNNAAAGGSNPSRTHIDGIIRRPTWTVDGDVVVEAGRIVVEAF